MAIFTVTDRWGAVISLTEQDWDRIAAKHPEIDGHTREVRATLEAPWVVYGGRWKDSKVFYARDLLDSPFRGCYVAVVVRYTGQAGSIRTVYFPLNIEGRLGRLLHAER